METGNLAAITLRLTLVLLAILGAAYGLHRLKVRLKAKSSGLWASVLQPMMPQLRSIILASGGLVLASTLISIVQPSPLTATVLRTAFNIVWILMLAWTLTVACSGLVSMTEWRFDVDVEDNLGARQIHTRVRVLQRIFVVLIWLGAFAGILMLFEQFRVVGGTLLASAGVLSIVLGLSAQKTFGAVIAGIQVALSHPINIDDVVIIEGEWGRIEDITFTYVVVKIWDLRRLVVPITYFLETPFQNWTKKSSELLGTVFLHVDYSTPLDSLRQELTRLCEQADGLWNGKTCLIQVTEAGPETMTVRALVSANDASRAWDLRCLVREGLIAYLQANHPECLPKRRLLLDRSGADGNGSEPV